MSAPTKPDSDTVVKRRFEQFKQRMDALEKRFDLGFITETQYLKKYKQASVRHLLWHIKHHESCLKEISKKVRLKKLFITLEKQRYLPMLATGKHSDRVMKQMEECIDFMEYQLQLYIAERNVHIQCKKKLETTLAIVRGRETE